VLSTLGCRLAQGFLFSRSVPAGELAELVADA
jgi:EAL domain-containing protein (putative c-di-GMP-specific phosphodiesterase class I)